jgi:cytochrome P450
VDRNATPEENVRANTELVEYLAGLIADAPTEGWVADLTERVRAGDVTVPEAAQLGVVLLIAGHETSANMISLGTLALLTNPDQLAVFRDNDDQKVGGQPIRAGEGIIVPLPVANWDPTVFPEPDTLDLHRQARQHHAFGFGIHQCVGQQLARVELQVVYSTLHKRIPTLRLANGMDQLRFKDDHFAYGVFELPVTWSP